MPKHSSATDIDLRIRILGDVELKREIGASTALFDQLSRSSLLKAPLERTELRLFREGLSEMAVMSRAGFESNAGAPEERAG